MADTGTQTSLGTGVLGKGLAENAAILEQYRPAYNKMAEDLMTQGQQPPEFVQWAAQQHATQATPRRSLLQALFSRS